MKSTIITFIVGLFILSTVCANAQDVIVKKDNSTILSKVTKISSTEIEYKKWSNLDGPTYTINKSDVVSINYQNGEVEIITNEIVKQERTESKVGGHMERYGNGLTLNGHYLSNEEVLKLVGDENYKTYLSARGQINAGRVFTAVFMISLITTVGFTAVATTNHDNDMLINAYVSGAIADISLLSMCILKGAGKGRMNWVADEYNKQHQGYSLNLSPSVIRCSTPQSQNNYGVGLTLSLNF